MNEQPPRPGRITYGERYPEVTTTFRGRWLVKLAGAEGFQWCTATPDWLRRAWKFKRLRGMLYRIGYVAGWFHHEKTCFRIPASECAAARTKYRGGRKAGEHPLRPPHPE